MAQYECVKYSKYYRDSSMPSGHIWLIHRRVNVDATSRRSIDVDATLSQRSMPAGHDLPCSR